MKKQIIDKFGKHYLLGADADGVKHYLKSPHWECDWFWGFGYIHTFTNNNNPIASRDISSHWHFSGIAKQYQTNYYDAFKQMFVKTPLTDKEIWTLCELMKTFYTMKDYAELVHLGGAHYTTNPCRDLIQNTKEATRINEIVLPKIFDEVEKILTPIAQED